MSVQVEVSDVIPCIYRFLAKNGFSEAAKAIKAKSSIDAKGGISNIKLLKLCKFYLKHHPELVVEKSEEEEEEEEEETPKVKASKSKKADKRKQSKEVEEEEEEEETPKVKSSKKANGVQNGKRKQSKEVEEDEEEEEEKKPETKKKVKTEAASSTQKKSKKSKVVEEEEEEEEEVKPKSKKQSEPAIKEKSASTSGLNKISNGFEEEEEDVPQKHEGRFSYVDSSIYEDLADHSKDVRFEAKSLFGNGGDAFGEFGNERLKDTRGKGFKKEKDKLKNKQFHGGSGRIDAFVRNSIKFDEE